VLLPVLCASFSALSFRWYRNGKGKVFLLRGIVLFLLLLASMAYAGATILLVSGIK